MNEIPQVPSSVSHKKLNKFMVNARKENTSSIDIELGTIEDESKSLKNLLDQWENISKEVLISMSNQNSLISERENPKSILALGAMEAHIRMALQALKASEESK
ncbi:MULTISPECIES: hypothetical protein [Prochlorococcus]|uniref:hypothetical protein n=1 Tax=Prochlorococcus TaxID=1218 RepID=UPI00056A8AB1|nr:MULTISPECIES: hypothetical protein [Prochlorococcus]